jgi:transposase InsO family protein
VPDNDTLKSEKSGNTPDSRNQIKLKGVLLVKTKRSGKRKVKKRGKGAGPYPFEFRLQVVRLYLEEGYTASLIREELGVGTKTISTWAKKYRQYGEEGLKDQRSFVRRSQTPRAVKDRIVDIKRSNPSYGSRRISDILRRFFLVRTSPTTVHKTLSQKALIDPAKHKPKRNPAKPRFFERANPNQMWQSDILSFRLGGKSAYLIGFMDDYSRYITALGLYRSQTAEHVLETYRRGISEYGLPKEMLTDNGRQYTNWRGTTRFERELKKDRVSHIKSRPHHPMTLGKIERFWKTILNEFLQRAQFDSFDQACERVNFWAKYYNYKRPHQGIGGLCPADRFFEIQHALKKTLERGIEENILELALRGQPRDPFYMVGRMGDQSVVIRAEKGKVKMLVDGERQRHEKELVYDIGKDIDYENEQKKTQNVRSAAEGNRRTVHLDRAAHSNRSVSGYGRELGTSEPVAEPGDGRDDLRTGAEEESARCGPECPADQIDRKEYQQSHRQACEAGGASGDHPEGQKQESIAWDRLYGQLWEKAKGQGPKKGRDDHESPVRTDDGNPGG